MADNITSGSEFRNTRSDSTSSASTTSSTAPSSSPSSTPRRSSNLFEGLQNQKRSSDPESIARRQSISEQRITPGFLGKMWNEYVHGK